MDYLGSLRRIKAKINSSKTYCLMRDFNELVQKYPPAWIDLDDSDLSIKEIESVQKKITKLANPLYPFHTRFAAPAHDFCGSIVVGVNETTVNCMVRELAMYCVALDRFYKEIVKANNNVYLRTWYKAFTLKSADFEKVFVEDLKYFSTLYGFEICIKDTMLKLKEVKKTLSQVE